MLTDEKIEEIASGFVKLIGGYWEHEKTIPENQIEEFARAIEDAVIEDQKTKKKD